MTQRNNGDKTLREILGEALEQDAMDTPPSPMSYEEFEDLLAESRNRDTKRKKRRVRIISIAALFVIAIIGSALVFHTFTSDVGANKNAPEEIITEDGVVIEDKGWGSSSEDNWIITDWDEIKTVKATFPDMMVPQYIPEGYAFEELVIEQIETGDKAYGYVFSNKHAERIEIAISNIDKNETAIKVDFVSRSISTKKGDVYIQDDIQMATIHMNDGLSIRIRSNLPDEEIIKLIENLEL